MSTKSTEHPTKIECVACRRLPASGDVAEQIRAFREFRPRVPRKIDPRSLETHKTQPRCTTHWLAWRNGQRAKMAAARSRKRSGLTEETRRIVKEMQGGLCPCGARLLSKGGRRLEPDADHDHDLALTHDHPEDVACEMCFRGFLCRHCNREVIGFLSHSGSRGTSAVITALRSLADYLEDPPMRQLQRLGVGDSDSEESA